MSRTACSKLRVDRLDLLQLHRIDAKVPAAEQFGVLADLQQEGKVAALGLSEVSVADIAEAEQHFTVATVQNRYNLTDTKSSRRASDYSLSTASGFCPGRRRPSQVALAWLLKRSPVMMPIPGTGSVAHLEANMAAAELELDDTAYAEITRGRRRLSRGLDRRVRGEGLLTLVAADR